MFAAQVSQTYSVQLVQLIKVMCLICVVSGVFILSLTQILISLFTCYSYSVSVKVGHSQLFSFIFFNPVYFKFPLYY